MLDRRAGRSRELRELLGFVPSGDRSFYLRLSGLENLGVLRAHARLPRPARAHERADELLEAVGLTEAARRPVNTYSHGMQKRLSFARALIHEPTRPARRRGHARPRSRGLPAGPRAHAGAGPVRDRGASGPRSGSRSCRLRATASPCSTAAPSASRARWPPSRRRAAATATSSGSARARPPRSRRSTRRWASCGRAAGGARRGSVHALLTLAPGVSLGSAIAALATAGAEVVSCRDERPPIERAFLAVTGERAA